ncbi:MAG: hypothetical protein HRT44_04080 [Bdellovibrionales bacterium]|nr:hypothetical protein [Bdellovibrionales bacterium]
MYSDALRGLLIETALAAVYARSTIPDFRNAWQGTGTAINSSPVLSQSALVMQRGLMRSRGFRNTIDHMIQTLQKMVGGVVFATNTATAPLLCQMLGGDTLEDMTYQRGSDLFPTHLVSVGFFFSMANSLSVVETLLACDRIPEIPEGWLNEEDQATFDRMVELQAEAECLTRPTMEEVTESSHQWQEHLTRQALGN